ncbi:hypothetical protein OSB04_027056, partial [Centaurea solstitialis]
MSENAIRDLNLLPISESSSEKDIFAKPYVVGDKQRTSMGSLLQSHVNGNEVGVVFEVEYIEFEKLDDLQDVDKNLKMLLPGLESKDWVLNVKPSTTFDIYCEPCSFCLQVLSPISYAHVAHDRYSLRHTLNENRERVISLVVKSLKNPRSAVCKTGIMTSADIFKAFGDHIIDLLDLM